MMINCNNKIANSVRATIADEELAIASRMKTKPTKTHQIAIRALVNTLRAAGIWDKFDLFYVFAAQDAVTACLNWVSLNYNCTLVNSPAFVAYEGFTGNGSSSYIKTGWNPNTQGINFQLNDCNLGAYSRTDQTENVYVIGCIETGTVYLRMALSYDDDPTIGMVATVNSNVGKFSANANSLGTHATERTGASAYALYRNGSSLSAATNASTTIPNGELYILTTNSAGSPTGGYSTHQISCAFAGASLGTAGQAALHAAIESYMDALSKGVVA